MADAVGELAEGIGSQRIEMFIATMTSGTSASGIPICWARRTKGPC